MQKTMVKEEFDAAVAKLRAALDSSEAVLIGAGSGLSTAAGYAYSGDKFKKYFGDFVRRYGIQDIHSGGFYEFRDMETYWAWWSRHIWLNRYEPIPSDLYSRLRELVKDKNYFVLTTNFDHCFQRAGFEKERLFYNQGDYGLLQSRRPHGEAAEATYENRHLIKEMLIVQGFRISSSGRLIPPDVSEMKMKVPAKLIPRSPEDGDYLVPSLRKDKEFVEDEGWRQAFLNYTFFKKDTEHARILYFELGVGKRTPENIKYPFYEMTAENKKAVYACVNLSEAVAPEQIRSRSICIQDDIAKVIRALG